MTTLLNKVALSAGWVLEEHNSPRSVQVVRATTPANVFARVYVTLQRVPSARIVRVFYFQGATPEEREIALKLGRGAASPLWRQVAPEWYSKREKNGLHRFQTTLGRQIEEAEEFLRLAAEFDVESVVGLEAVGHDSADN